MKPDKASSLFFIALSIVIIWSSYRLRLGTPASPGPGLLPFLAGVGLVAVSIVHLLKEGVRAHSGDMGTVKQLWAGMNWHKPMMIAAALILYTIVLDNVGFLASTAVILIFLFRIVEPMRWFVATVSGMAASFVSYAIFALWLQVQLPRGAVERLLFS
jgi:putative tricarboxylic transport membrane protein